MALILVAEPEGRHVERIRDALAAEGWRVKTVQAAEEALAAADLEPPQLVLVNRELEGAERLFSTFSRRTGGPGVVALLPERGDGPGEPLADDFLTKPFTDQDLRLAVRRGLAPRPAAPSEQGTGTAQQLTAADIFGDVVAEVESEIETGAEGGETETAASEAGAGGDTAGESPGAEPPPAEPTPEPPRLRARGELDLEKTLSGLRRELDAGPRARKPPEKGKRKRSKARRTPGSQDELDVDALLSETLSGLDLPEGKKRKKKKAKAAAETQETETPPAETPQAVTPQTETPQTETPKTEVPESPQPSATSSVPPVEDTPGAVESGGETEAAEGAELDWGDFEDLTDEGPAPTQVEPPPDFEPSFGKGFEAEEEEAPAGEQQIDLGDPFQGGALQEVEEPVPGREAGTLAEWLESGDDSMYRPVEEASKTATGPPSGTASASAETAAARSPAAPEGEWEGEGKESGGDEESRSFGQYTLLDRIAVGGMAEVWKARMRGVEGFQKTVAIKKILPHLTDNDDFVNMFIDEAKLAAQLSHPNIIHIYDLGKIGGHFYIAMEYVEGKNLRAVLNESRKKAQPFPLGVSLLVAARLASALDYAHRKKDFEDRELGLVHRDVSPQNVLLSDEGDIKLCDFGIVKAVSKASQTQMGALKGKLQYMSPEQAWGKDVDARSDIFSLGALLFEMLTGQRLFSGDSEISVLEAVRQCRVVAPRDLVPELPEAVQEITLRALEQDPDRRFQSAGEMQGQLEELLYSIKPTPSQTDLAEFLAVVERAPELDPEELSARNRDRQQAGGEPAAAGETREESPEEAQGAEAPVSDQGTGTGAQPPPAEAADGPAEVQISPGALPTAGLSEDEGPLAEAPEEEAPDTEALRAEDEFPDIEEGGSGGKLWLVIVLILVALAGAAVSWYFWQSSRGETAPAAPQPDSRQAPASGGVPEAGTGGSVATEPEEAGTETPPTPGDELPEEEPTDGRDLGADAPGADAEGPAEDGTGAEDTTSLGGAPQEARQQAARQEAADREATAGPPATSQAAGRAVTTRKAEAAEPARPAATSAEPPPRERARSLRPAGASGRVGEAETDSSRASESRGAGTDTGSAQRALQPARASDGPGAEDVPSSTAPPREEAEGETPEADRPSEPLRLREPSQLEDAVAADESADVADAGGTTSGEAEERSRERSQKVSSPPPTPPVREGDLVGPGPGVRPPRLVSFDKPSYPPLARKMKIQGDVVLSLLVDETGRVTEARVLQGVRKGVGLNERALEAARRARYEPATKDGVKVKMWTTLRIPFRL